MDSFVKRDVSKDDGAGFNAASSLSACHCGETVLCSKLSLLLYRMG